MRRTMVIAGALLLASTSAWAQNTGTVTLNGRVDSTLDIKFNGSTLVGGAVETGTNVVDTPLAFVMELGNVADMSIPGPKGGVVQVALRGNSPGTMQLAAAVVGSNMDAVGGDGVGLDDIGFGIAAIDTSGANVGPGGAAAAIQAPYAFDASTTPIGATDPTLNSLGAAPIVVQSTTAGVISNGGTGLTDPSNAVLVDLSFGIMPAMYTPVGAGNFNAVVTFTLTSP